MADLSGSNVYTRMGVRPAINAGGYTTTWGGSTPSPAVKKAMDEAEMAYVDMYELLEKSGAHLADLLDVEGAYVTSGCYAAQVLSAAACIAGTDAEKQARLPDTSGMKNEILIQKCQRYGFDRSYTIPGSILVEVGDETGATAEQLEAAIGPNTAAVAYFVQPDWADSVLSLEEVVRVAHARGVPVIADAASRNYPIDFFLETARSADLVCFGGKYFDAPQSTGFVCGRKDLVDIVSDLGFGNSKRFGRGMKLDRQEIVGLVTAVEEWVRMDHEARYKALDTRLDAMQALLEGVSAIRETRVVETKRPPGLTLYAVFDTSAAGKDARAVAREMEAGDPCIRILAEGTDIINICVHTLNQGEDRIVAQKLSESLGGELS